LVNGVVSIDRAGNTDTGDWIAMRNLPGDEVLLGAVKGLFLARAINGAVTIAPAGNADTGPVVNGFQDPRKAGVMGLLAAPVAMLA
jgi:hypothetical protein